MQALYKLLAGNAKRLSCSVQIESVTRLVLYFGQKNGFALKGGSSGDPDPLRLLANHLRMGVLGDLPDEILPVFFRHPVLRLDLLFGVDPRLKSLLIRHGNYFI